MKKTVRLILCSLLMLFVFTGCLPHEPLTSTAIVEAIGLDYKEDEYHLSLQLYYPQGGGSDSSVTVGKSNTVLLTAKGKTIEEAVKAASLQQGKTVNLGFCQVLILGESILQQKLSDTVSYFQTLPNTRWTMQVAAAEDAKNIVSAKLKQGVSEGAQISKLLSGQNGKGVISSVNFFEFSRTLTNQEGYAHLPVLSVRTVKSEQSRIEPLTLFFAENTVLIRNHQMAELLSPEETRGFLLLQREFKKREETIVTEDGEETIAITSVKCDYQSKTDTLRITLFASPKQFRSSDHWKEALFSTVSSELQAVFEKIDPLREIETEKTIWKDENEHSAAIRHIAILIREKKE